VIIKLLQKLLHRQLLLLLLLQPKVDRHDARNWRYEPAVAYCMEYDI
jgi:hypothetical protein